jgi:predicted nucleotidyltransferase
VIVDNRFINIKCLEVVMVFGSVARNDDDINSDIDIFALVEDQLTESAKEDVIKEITSFISGEDVNVSIYTKEIFDRMSKDGSLFLWHLKKEGKYLFNKNNKDIFVDLADFNMYEKNLKMYKDIFSTVRISLSTNGVNSYDLSMLFFLCRNISILTCFKIGKPDFGRYSAYETLIEHLKHVPLSMEEFLYLSKWRINYTRGIDEEISYPSEDNLLKIIKNVSVLFDICEIIIEGNGSYEKY